LDKQVLWFRGVCDDLYRKLVAWRDNYERGNVSRTRKKLAETGEVIDFPVQYAMKIPWHQRELDHLVRILQATGAQASLVEDMIKVQQGLRHAPAAIHGMRIATMVFWKQDVVEMVRCLDKARGASNEIDDFLRERAGKGGLFKV
jgi:hypothetical protein